MLDPSGLRARGRRFGWNGSNLTRRSKCRRAVGSSLMGGGLGGSSHAGGGAVGDF